METRIQQLIQLSSNLIATIDSWEFEDLEAYMEERDHIFTELNQVLSVSEQTSSFRSQVERIIEMDTVIIGRMTVKLAEINIEIDKITKGRRTKTLYDSGSYGDGSLFFDAKR